LRPESSRISSCSGAIHCEKILLPWSPFPSSVPWWVGNGRLKPEGFAAPSVQVCLACLASFFKRHLHGESCPEISARHGGLADEKDFSNDAFAPADHEFILAFTHSSPFRVVSINMGIYRIRAVSQVCNRYGREAGLVRRILEIAADLRMAFGQLNRPGKAEACLQRDGTGWSRRSLRRLFCCPWQSRTVAARLIPREEAQGEKSNCYE
jgi:hypothetical protein